MRQLMAELVAETSGSRRVGPLDTVPLSTRRVPAQLTRPSTIRETLLDFCKGLLHPVEACSGKSQRTGLARFTCTSITCACVSDYEPAHRARPDNAELDEAK